MDKTVMGIPLTQGKVALVDAEDYERVNQHKWHYHKQGYARRMLPIGSGKKKVLCMHHMIIDVPEGFHPDHINGNGLDNRRVNLRIATPTQNSHNAKMRGDNTTGHRGIFEDKKYNKWRVAFKIDGVQKQFGYYDSKQEAIDMYHSVSKSLRGEFARCCDE